jgi:hypothetical protein
VRSLTRPTTTFSNVSKSEAAQSCSLTCDNTAKASIIPTVLFFLRCLPRRVCAEEMLPKLSAASTPTPGSVAEDGFTTWLSLRKRSRASRGLAWFVVLSRISSALGVLLSSPSEIRLDIGNDVSVLSGGDEELMEEDIFATGSKLGGVGVTETRVPEVIVLPVLSLLPGNDTPES